MTNYCLVYRWPYVCVKEWHFICRTISRLDISLSLGKNRKYCSGNLQRSLKVTLIRGLRPITIMPVFLLHNDWRHVGSEFRGLPTFLLSLKPYINLHFSWIPLCSEHMRRWHPPFLKACYRMNFSTLASFYYLFLLFTKTTTSVSLLWHIQP